MHKYPFSCRLILFLLPFFLIFLANISNKAAVLNIVLLLISILSINTYTPDMKICSCSYAREIIRYLKTYQRTDDILLITQEPRDYWLYMADYNYKTKPNDIILPDSCNGNVEACRNVVNKLPKGHYYLLISYADKVAQDNKAAKLNINIKTKICNAVYFEKE